MRLPVQVLDILLCIFAWLPGAVLCEAESLVESMHAQLPSRAHVLKPLLLSAGQIYAVYLLVTVPAQVFGHTLVNILAVIMRLHPAGWQGEALIKKLPCDAGRRRHKPTTELKDARRIARWQAESGLGRGSAVSGLLHVVFV